VLVKSARTSVLVLAERWLCHWFQKKKSPPATNNVPIDASSHRQRLIWGEAAVGEEISAGGGSAVLRKEKQGT